MSDEVFEYDESTEGSDDYRVTPEDFANIYVIPSDWTVSTLRAELRDIIELNPEFQRRSVWSTLAKSKFIESLILGIPIPQILLAEDGDNRNHYLVLDGKQRLLTILEFFEGALIDGRKFKLRNLDDLQYLNDKTWEQIEREFPRDARAILGAQIRTAVIRGWHNDNILYEIFHRLNSGSVRLSPMELRMALIRGPFIRSVVNRTADSAAMQEMLGLSMPDKRMRDVEITIRHLAFVDRRIPYRGNLKVFLDEYCRVANSDFDEQSVTRKIRELEVAIELGIRLFGVREFSSRFVNQDNRFEGRFNRAVFDVLAGSLVEEGVQSAAESDHQKFVNLFKQVSADRDFQSAIQFTTKTPDATRTRFKLWYSLLESEYGVELALPVIENVGNNG